MNKKMIIGVLMMILLVLSGIVWAPNGVELKFAGGETKVTDDLPWTSAQIQKIMVLKKGYIGESTDGYKFYKAKDPDGKIGVLRIQSGVSKQEISFAYGDIGAGNLKSNLDANKFRDIEIQGSSGWYWPDDDLTTSDLTKTFTELNSQIKIADSYQPIVGVTTLTTQVTKTGAGKPSSSPDLITIKEGSETGVRGDWAWTPDQINQVRIYDNGYIGKSEDGYEFFRGEGPEGKKGVFRVQFGTEGQEVSFAEHANPEQITHDNIAATLLSTNNFHDIEIDGSTNTLAKTAGLVGALFTLGTSAMIIRDDDLTTSDLVDYGSSGQSLAEGFVAARETSRKLLAAEGAVKPAPTKIEPVKEVKDINAGDTIDVNGQQYRVTSKDEKTGIVNAVDSDNNPTIIDTQKLKDAGVAVNKITTSSGTMSTGFDNDAKVKLIQINGLITQEEKKLSSTKSEIKTIELQLSSKPKDSELAQKLKNAYEKEKEITKAILTLNKQRTETANQISKIATGATTTKQEYLVTLKVGTATIQVKKTASSPEAAQKLAIESFQGVNKVTVLQAQLTTKAQIESEKNEYTFKKVDENIVLILKDGNYVSSVTTETKAKEEVKRLQLILDKELAAKSAKRPAGSILMTGYADKDGYPIYKKAGKLYALDVASKSYVEMKEGDEVTKTTRSKEGAEVSISYVVPKSGDVLKEKSVSIKDKNGNLYTVSYAEYLEFGTLSRTTLDRISVENEGKTLILSDSKGDSVKKQEKNPEEGVSLRTSLNYDKTHGVYLKVMSRGTDSSYKKPYTKIVEYEYVSVNKDVNGDKVIDAKDVEKQVKIDVKIVYTQEEVESTNAFGKKTGTYTRNIRVETIYEKDPKTGEQLESAVVKHTDATTGEPTKIEAGGFTFVYDVKSGKVVVDGVPENELTKEQKEALGKSATYLKEHAAWTSRNVFSTIRYTLTDYSGLGYYSKLFMDDEDLEEWREDIDELFADAYLGTQYWVSEICKHQYDKQVDGVAFVEVPGGMVSASAHVEGRLSTKTELPDGSNEYIYKISASVRPMGKEGEDDVKFKIIMKPGNFNVLGKTIELDAGKSFSKSGNSMILASANKKYSEVCIDFTEKGKFEDGEICNDIK